MITIMIIMIITVITMIIIMMMMMIIIIKTGIFQRGHLSFGITDNARRAAESNLDYRVSLQGTPI